MTTTLDATLRLTRRDTNETFGGDFNHTIEEHSEGGVRIANIGSTAITITSDLVKAGYLYLEHRSTAHNIFISLDGAVTFKLELLVGGRALIPLSSVVTVFHVKTSAAASQKFYFEVLEQA